MLEKPDREPNSKELFMMMLAQQDIKEELLPVPFFVISPGAIQRQNWERVNSLKRTSVRAIAMYDMTMANYIWDISALHVLFVRGLVMRLQWLLQLGALIALWKFLL